MNDPITITFIAKGILGAIIVVLAGVVIFLYREKQGAPGRELGVARSVTAKGRGICYKGVRPIQSSADNREKPE